MCYNGHIMTQDRSIPEIVDLASAFYGSATLFAALELGVFAAIADVGDGVALEPLAEKLDVSPRGLRLLLDACVKNEFGEKYLGKAINDVVIAKGGAARMLHFGLYINQTHLMDYKADGLIVSSPTGSTAYSLSAGGPILNPTIRGVLLTPICAHTFQIRPLVVGENDLIRLKIGNVHQDVIVTLDGQESFYVQPGDEIIVRKANTTAQIVKFEDKDYYKVLRTKLLSF